MRLLTVGMSCGKLGAILTSLTAPNPAPKVVPLAAPPTAHPELAALIGHTRQHGGGPQSAAAEQPGDQEQHDHCDAETEVREGELR